MNLADVLVEEADGLVARFDQNGPQLLAVAAERLAGPTGAWTVLAEAREEIRTRVIRSPLDLSACVSLGWLCAALAVRGALDRQPSEPATHSQDDGVDRWGSQLRRAVLDSGFGLSEAARAAGFSGRDLHGLVMCRRPPTGRRRAQAVALLTVIGQDLANWFEDTPEESAMAAYG